MTTQPSDVRSKRLHGWLLLLALALVAVGASIPLLFPSCPVTRAAFDRIENGLTEAQVEKLLGGPMGDYTTWPTNQDEVGDAIGPDDIGPTDSTAAWLGDEGMVQVVFGRDGLVRNKAFTPWQRLNVGLIGRTRWRWKRWRAEHFGGDD